MPQYNNYYGPENIQSIGLSMDTMPGPNDDYNSGWYEGALWQYITPITGVIVMYMCIDGSVGNAKWKII